MKNKFKKLQEEYILNNGWEKEYKNSYVKTEWLHEPEILNQPPHLCPHWYCTKTLDDAYNIAIEEKDKKEFLVNNGWEIKDDKKEKEDFLLNNGWVINDDKFIKSTWINKSNSLSLNQAYLMETSL